MRFKNLLVLLVIVLGFFVRIYNFENRITFGSEQARSLVVSGKYIKEKPSLLGQEYFRVTSKGHKLFSGALFSYSLVPLQVLFNFDPLPVTLYFAILNILTGCALFLLVKWVLGFETALFSLVLFLFSDYMIYHSLFIWILNYLPAVGLFLFYFLFLFSKTPKPVYAFLLGVLSGMGINLQYLFIPFAALVLLFVIWKGRNRVLDFLLFGIGSLTGNFPMVLFDLRHDFYHARTLFQYILDTLNNPSQSFLTYYHFLFLWPFLAVIGAMLLDRLWKMRKKLVVFLILTYVALNLVSPRVSFKKPTGMPEGLVYRSVIAAAKTVVDDASGNFNVAALLDFDTRAFILRYPIEFMFGKKPLGVEEYPQSEKLYVLASKSYNFNDSIVWEIAVFKPFKVALLKDVGAGYAVFKLTRANL